MTQVAITILYDCNLSCNDRWAISSISSVPFSRKENRDNHFTSTSLPQYLLLGLLAFLVLSLLALAFVALHGLPFPPHLPAHPLADSGDPLPPFCPPGSSCP